MDLATKWKKKPHSGLAPTCISTTCIVLVLASCFSGFFLCRLCPLTLCLPISWFSSTRILWSISCIDRGTSNGHFAHAHSHPPKRKRHPTWYLPLAFDGVLCWHSCLLAVPSSQRHRRHVPSRRRSFRRWPNFAHWITKFIGFLLNQTGTQPANDFPYCIAHQLTQVIQLCCLLSSCQ